LVHREPIIALAAKHLLPAIYGDRTFVTIGGLLSYGPNRVDPYRDGRRLTSTAASRVRNQPISLYRRRPSTSWSSTSRRLAECSMRSPTCSRLMRPSTGRKAKSLQGRVDRRPDHPHHLHDQERPLSSLNSTWRKISAPQRFRQLSGVQETGYHACTWPALIDCVLIALRSPLIEGAMFRPRHVPLTVCSVRAYRQIGMNLKPLARVVDHMLDEGCSSTPAAHTRR
jgi:hypothetical protein